MRNYSPKKIDERSGPTTSNWLRSSGSGKEALGSLPLIAKENALVNALITCSDLTDGFSHKTKEYKEPWDYEHTYYLTSLPLRPLYSGDPGLYMLLKKKVNFSFEHAQVGNHWLVLHPQILNEAEFGEAARNREYDDSSINPASELGLLDESKMERIFFFQLPPKLPTVKRSANMKGQERIETSSPSKASGSTGDYNLEDLLEGYMGKLLVYKSGKVKLKVGETFYDVSPGLDCIFPENVAAVNALDRNFCLLGDNEKRAIVTPDLDLVLDSHRLGVKMI